SRNLTAFLQSNGLTSALNENGHEHNHIVQRHPSLHAALQQHLGTLQSSLSSLSSPPITPSNMNLTQNQNLLPPSTPSLPPLPAPIPTSLPPPVSLPSSFLDSSPSLQSLQHNLAQHNQNIPQSLPHPQPPTGIVQQINRADIVTVQPRWKQPASGGRGSIGLAVHVDGYLYHGKKTRLDGTKLLYCLDRTKYNCMAVAELFPNGTFRAKRPHTGHPPNPEECEVRLAKRMMRERAREHPEYTSKEIVREMINDPNISEEAKKRLENYESLRKFVYRGRNTQRRKPEPVAHPTPIKMEEGAPFSLPTSIAALLNSNQSLFTSMAPLNTSFAQTLLPPVQNTFAAAQDEIARLMREIQNGRSIEEIRVNKEFNGPVEPSTSTSSSTSTNSAPSVPTIGVWHTVDCEIIDFSRMADRQYHYIFHAKDAISRFSFACPMTSTSQSELLEAIKSLFFAYGPAHVVRVDQSYHHLEQELAVHFPLTAVEYLVPRKNAQGNLIARREATMMKERIFAYLMESGKKEWAKELPMIKYAHNTEWIDEIECTPLEKFFSRNLPTGMSSRCSEENNESHDGMSEDGEEVHNCNNVDLFHGVKEEPVSEMLNII
ncbi:hypothetical protein PFISCL1PPCAC_19526, partial [Pristionchus fissidentatus]